MKSIKTALIVAIGDELLIGQTIDTNSSFIAQKLVDLNIQIIAHVNIADNKRAIEQQLDSAKGTADLIIFTGGLGPTNDDITKLTLTNYFGGALVENEQVLAHIKSIFENRKRLLLPNNLAQALLPNNAKVLWNKLGTAAGMWFENDNYVCISMPGVPFEMKTIFTEEAIPKIQELTTTTTKILHKHLLFSGIAESDLANRIEEIERNLPPHIHIAYLPSYACLKLRLDGFSENEHALSKDLDNISKQIQSKAMDNFLSNDDTSLDKILFKELKSLKLTIATAESCTGGLISSLIADIPGASSILLGGIVSYANSIKTNVLGVPNGIVEQFTEISKETAESMATNVLKQFKASVSVSVTGFLGPDGGYEGIPIGTTFISVTDGTSFLTQKYKFRYDRYNNKQLAAYSAIAQVLFFLKQNHS